MANTIRVANTNTPRTAANAPVQGNLYQHRTSGKVYIGTENPRGGTMLVNLATGEILSSRRGWGSSRPGTHLKGGPLNGAAAFTPIACTVTVVPGA